MNRRSFIGTLGGVLVTPLFSEAQQAGKVYRIGLIDPGSPIHERRTSFKATWRSCCGSAWT